MIESKVVKVGCEEMLQCIENMSEGWERPKSYKTGLYLCFAGLLLVVGGVVVQVMRQIDFGVKLYCSYMLQ